MLHFLSFIVALTVLSGAVMLIVATIRESGELMLTALTGTTMRHPVVVDLPRRPIRQMRQASPFYVPLRAAA